MTAVFLFHRYGEEFGRGVVAVNDADFCYGDFEMPGDERADTPIRQVLLRRLFYGNLKMRFRHFLKHFLLRARMHRYFDIHPSIVREEGRCYSGEVWGMEDLDKQ